MRKVGVLLGDSILTIEGLNVHSSHSTQVPVGRSFTTSTLHIGSRTDGQTETLCPAPTLGSDSDPNSRLYDQICVCPGGR